MVDFVLALPLSSRFCLHLGRLGTWKPAGVRQIKVSPASLKSDVSPFENNGHVNQPNLDRTDDIAFHSMLPPLGAFPDVLSDPHMVQTDHPVCFPISIGDVHLVGGDEGEGDEERNDGLAEVPPRRHPDERGQRQEVHQRHVRLERPLQFIISSRYKFSTNYCNSRHVE